MQQLGDIVVVDEEQAINLAYLFADITMGNDRADGLTNLSNMSIYEIGIKAKQLVHDSVSEPEAYHHTVNSLLVLLREAENRSMRDSLTGMYNRAYVTQMVAFHLERIDRGLGKHGGMIYIDLDKFKPINDTYGHDAGDQALITASKAITSSVRGIDVPARMGGDEFAVFLSDADYHQAVAVSERLMDEFSNLSITIEDNLIPIQASIGMTLIEPGQTVTEIFKAADREMYKVKNSESTPYITVAETSDIIVTSAVAYNDLLFK
jgi:diguanylate cyclase (GGDEF)-like protein